MSDSEVGEISVKCYLDPGCPTFLGVYPTNLWDITPKKEGHPGSRYGLGFRAFICS